MAVFFLYFIFCACILTFIIFFLVRVVRYAGMPVHLRWELYPVPHQTGFSGGERHRLQDLKGELEFMTSEIFFFARYYRKKRGYWYFVYPFHIGLFLLIGWLVLVLVGSITSLAGTPVSAGAGNAWGSLVYYVTLVVGAAGFFIATFGCMGLIIKRCANRDLKLYTTPLDYLNLFFILVILLTGLSSWVFFDRAFESYREFLKGLVMFNSAAVPDPVIYINILLICLFLAYMPFTNMMHYVAKYFTYHRVLWDDRPNLKGSKVERRVNALLSRPVTWSAPHVSSSKVWGEVSNGPAGDDTEKEKVERK